MSRIVFVATLLLTACSSEPKPITPFEEWQAVNDEDEWIEPASEKLRARFALAPQQDCVPVTEEKVETAVGMLDRRPAVALGPSLLEEWLGKPLEGEGVPIMLRAFGSANGVNHVALVDGEAMVRHDALGGFSGVHRHPCVLRLPRAPDTVYSDAGYDL